MLVVDTGGLADDPNDIEHLMADQVRAAIDESDLILFIVDGRYGMTAADEMIAGELRKLDKPVRIVLNKTEGLDKHTISAEFYSLGLGEPFSIAAAHGQGVRPMLQSIKDDLPTIDKDQVVDQEDQGIRIAVVGRPNVGKSTLINRLLGEDRLVTFDMPGTTRDSVFVPFEREGKKYTLIDTAGVRRRSKVNDHIEKFSVIKTLQSIEECNVVIMLLDGRQEVADQDVTLLGHVIESGRALVIAVNKWDGLDPDQRDMIKAQLDRQLNFIDYAKIFFVSALHGSGVGLLLEAAEKAYESAMSDLATPELTRVLEAALEQHQPPMVRGRRIKLKYAHQGGVNPPIIVIHGNQLSDVPGSYERYLSNVFRKAFKLHGTPVRIEFRSSDNPFKGKKNKLTPRQQKKRQRMMKHIKKKK